MRVLFVASEAYPLVKTGGLADVSRALPLALCRKGADVRLLLPGYSSALEALSHRGTSVELEDAFGIVGARLIPGLLPNSDLPLWLLDAPSLYAREGGPYQDYEGRDWPDNASRFAFLAHVGAKMAMGLPEIGWQPDIVHANDWHTGLLPLLLAQAGPNAPKSVFTIHNMAFQGNFPADALGQTGVRPDYFNSGDIEFFGQISFLKAGIRFADSLTTVSPTYAKEILTPEFGCGMDGLLRSRSSDLHGILNGVEYGLWDPAYDPFLPARYDANCITTKKACKLALQDELGLVIDPDAPLLGFVSRITDQKMADVVLKALPWFMKQEVQFALVGQGDPKLQGALVLAGRQHPGSISIRIGYDEALAHRLQAGADILLAPARFEPCGLTQLYAMRYGTPPVVRRTGGLADTVVDVSKETIAECTATGFLFEQANLQDFQGAVVRALDVYRKPPVWRRLQLSAMHGNFSWDASAQAYLELYHDLGGLPIPPQVQWQQAHVKD